MPKVIILGSSNAVPSKDHENTHLVIIGEERTILVDCVSNPIVRLEQAGVDFNDFWCSSSPDGFVAIGTHQTDQYLWFALHYGPS